MTATNVARARPQSCSSKMAPRMKHNSGQSTRYLYFLLLATLVSIVSAAESPLCPIPSPAPKHLPAGEDALPLLASFRLSAGYFFGGEDINFARDDGDVASLLHIPRTLSLFPIHVDRTPDSALVHVAGSLTLSGGRGHHAVPAHRRNGIGSRHSVTFHLDGYYSSATHPCSAWRAGSGAYTTEEEEGGDSFDHLRDVVLKFRFPNPSTLSDPFVTGSIKGAGFEPISLVAYAEGDGYRYGERATCPALPRQSLPLLPLQPEPGADFSCLRLKERLMRLYKLQYGGGGGGGPAPLRLREPRMHVDLVRCTADGAVRLYAAFSNDTNMFVQKFEPRVPRFMVTEEAVVAEGHWDSARNLLCLRACRVVRSSEPAASLAVQENCGIGMSFWFPAVWTVRDRSVVAGTLWNSSHGTDGKRTEAKKHYLTAVSKLMNSRDRENKAGPFPAAGYTYHDLDFRFVMEKLGTGTGEAHPVTIGSAVVYGDRLAADASFSSQHAAEVAAGTEHDLVPINFSSLTVEERKITAEGVYDPKRGVLCLVGCQEFDSSSTDCRILITVQFASVDAKARGDGKGVIRSLRNETDSLYFDQVDISFYGMMSGEQVAEAISRMDMESVMLVVFTTLPCVFTAIQILHAKRKNPDDAFAATSITMLVVMALGYVAPLLTRAEALFTSRRNQWVPFQSYVPYELSQAMLRAPTLIAFVLQLRLIQLAWNGRKKNKQAEAWSAAERKSLLLMCLPLYLLGGALTVVHHLMYGRAAQQEWLAVRIGPEPATVWEDLLSSAGLALDAFLLPQVATNMFCGGERITRAISPWFYVGGSVVRAMPHVYDVIRARGYVQSMTPSNVYASSRDDRFGMGWDIVVPCGSALLVLLLFLQQRLGAPFFLRSRRPLGEYEMVSTQVEDT
ncbi:hypothetical protein PR202_gb05208 [Eleusine coracana subsp. coracana]|uniref:RING-type E3 ubiquitin transferase n=1 Tax=Eleusine coracana subsp. coracana TaxID=191504 RepID=A0AAV5E6M5_ELECO|nr:hypothetical protein PR202_gb05208 [Eleusine coracana subsp. coracana]